MAFHSTVDTTQKFRLGTRKRHYDGTEWIYLKGVSSLVAYDAVTYDEAGVTTLLAANAKGPVAFAGAAIDATTKYGWFCIYGKCYANVVANCADNATLGRETTDGKIGDGRGAGDQIANTFSRNSTSSAATIYIQTSYPYVDDFMGA